MESVRVRVQFEDRRILRKSQRKEGLQQSWIMLRPHHKKVADLAYHLLHAFELQESCPLGLILSMDGFVLPPFESTSVLKDKDVVWVKRKEQRTAGTARLCGGKNSIKALEIADKQPVETNFQLLDFIKETGGYESESEEDKDEPSSDNNNVKNVANEEADSKKRKASRKLKSRKRKKSRLTNAEESLAACRDAGNDATKDCSRNDKSVPKDTQLEKDNSSHSKVKNDVASTSTNTRELSGKEESAAKLDSSQDDKVSPKDSQLEKDESAHSKGKKNKASASEADRKISVNSQSPPQGKGKAGMDASPAPSEAKTLPSRSARRKKLKRQWLREMRRIGEKEEGQRTQCSGENDSRKEFPGNDDQTLASQDDHRKSEEHQQHQQSSTVTADTGKQQPPPHYNSSNDMIVPIKIRPGHIRFEPLDEDADWQIQKNPAPVTTFQWNGVTDKKKGQKWGKEKVATKWTDDGHSKTKWTDDGHSKTKWTDDGHSKTKWTYNSNQKTAWTDNNHQRDAWNSNQNLDQEPSQAQGKETHPSDSTDFTKLLPYGPVPQEGDVVAYRLIELSSSWTPEVSPFRVGKISSCNQGSRMIRLVPIPEHPFDLEKTDKSLYGEDGSLEVDFTSLVDVRALNPDKSEPAVAAVGQTNGTPGGDSNAVASTQGSNKNEGNQARARENGGANVWEEVTQALSAKKAQLSQEDRWRRKESSAKGPPPPSSYRGLRGSALGPIMALLRAQNAML